MPVLHVSNETAVFPADSGDSNILYILEVGSNGDSKNVYITSVNSSSNTVQWTVHDRLNGTTEETALRYDISSEHACIAWVSTNEREGLVIELYNFKAEEEHINKASLFM
jgi:hypothetical protein